MRSVVKELVSADGKRKVEIVQRADGVFGFEAWRFSDEPREQCWIPDGQYSVCLATDAATAEREARGRVYWLKDCDSAG